MPGNRGDTLLAPNTRPEPGCLWILRIPTQGACLELTIHISHCLPWVFFQELLWAWKMLLVKCWSLSTEEQGCLQNERLSPLISAVPNSSVSSWHLGAQKCSLSGRCPCRLPCASRAPGVLEANTAGCSETQRLPWSWEMQTLRAEISRWGAVRC